MIYAFEGQPCAGKSTTAQFLTDAYVIPEVPKLFHRPDPEPADWYCDRHVARWEMAMRRGSNRFVILDGDPFQPLWYSWVFSDAETAASTDEIRAFYTRAVHSGRIRFPDCYVHFHADGETLLQRRLVRDAAEGEATITMKFHKWQRMSVPVQRYFEHLSAQFPDRVLFIESETLTGNQAQIEQHVVPTRSVKDSDDAMLECLIDFMASNPVSQVDGQTVAS